MKDGEDAETTVTLLQLFDKLNYMHSKIEEHFGSLQTDIASLRCELKDEIESVENNLKDVAKKGQGIRRGRTQGFNGRGQGFFYPTTRKI